MSNTGRPNDKPSIAWPPSRWQRASAIFGLIVRMVRRRDYHPVDVHNLLFPSTLLEVTTGGYARFKRSHRAMNEMLHPEYQAWFRAGLKTCRKHAYPFVWHITTSLECPKCESTLPPVDDVEGEREGR